MSEYLIEPKSFSPIELYHGERWLLDSGIISESTAGTLMAYGYLIPNVKNVKLEIDMDMDNNFQNPTCRYEITFPWLKSILFKRAKKALAKGTVAGKLQAFIYIKLGAPTPAVEDILKRMALEFLPKGFSVVVNVK